MPEILELIESAKQGRFAGSTHTSLIWETKSANTIRNIVVAYYIAMKYNGIEVNIQTIYPIVANTLENNYLQTYSILTGTYKYPHMSPAK